MLTPWCNMTSTCCLDKSARQRTGVSLLVAQTATSWPAISLTGRAALANLDSRIQLGQQECG
eukprot:1610180-Ditylum_brightwellii.AAC.1